MKKTITTMIALAVILVPAVAPARNERNACGATSKAVKQACRNEATDDHWIAIGNCNNLSDDAAREACVTDAKDGLKETKKECTEQFKAREDLCDALGKAPYDPVINPADFLSPAATAAAPNPYFPLVPGRTWVYQGGGETVTVTVTNLTRVIQGVTTIVVTDVVDEGAGPTEDTEDYFAQHVDGTVWYFGELSKTLENGYLTSLEGSFIAGVDGAKAGIIMKAHPMVGDVYRQEFALGNAEDAGEVVSTTATESVPAASCVGTCVVVRDFTPISPDSNEHKFFALGVGLILELDPETGEHELELISFTN